MARLLIVEDDDDLRPVIAEYLKLVGHEVHTAHGGRAALEQAARHGIDVVVLDWQLGDEPSGAALVQSLRLATHASLVAISADPTSLVEAREARVEATLPKPFWLADLSRLVSSLGEACRPSSGD